MSQNSKATDGSSSSSDASQDLFDGMEIDPSSGDDEVEMEDMMVTCCGIQSAKTDDSNGITVVWAATQKEQEHYGSIRGQEKKDSDEVNVADVKNLSIGTEEIKLKEEAAADDAAAQLKTRDEEGGKVCRRDPAVKGPLNEVENEANGVDPHSTPELQDREQSDCGQPDAGGKDARAGSESSQHHLDQADGPPLRMEDGTVMPLGMEDDTVMPLGMEDDTAMPLGMEDETAMPLGLEDGTVMPLGMEDDTVMPLGMEDDTTTSKMNFPNQGFPVLPDSNEYDETQLSDDQLKAIHCLEPNKQIKVLEKEKVKNFGLEEPNDRECDLRSLRTSLGAEIENAKEEFKEEKEEENDEREELERLRGSREPVSLKKRFFSTIGKLNLRGQGINAVGTIL